MPAASLTGLDLNGLSWNVLHFLVECMASETLDDSVGIRHRDRMFLRSKVCSLSMHSHSDALALAAVRTLAVAAAIVFVSL